MLALSQPFGLAAGVRRCSSYLSYSRTRAPWVLGLVLVEDVEGVSSVHAPGAAQVREGLGRVGGEALNAFWAVVRLAHLGRLVQDCVEALERATDRDGGARGLIESATPAGN